MIRLPRYASWCNGPLAKMIAFFRCKKSAEAYRKIWSDRGSPLKYITEEQAEALGKRLPKGWRIFYAMRYGNPSIDSVLSEIEKAELDELVVIPMYPHFSGPTTRTAIDEFYRCLPSHQISANIRVCNDWHDDAGYIEAQSHLIHDYAVANGIDPENSVLMFSTHSMPESYILNGDPYQEHILKSVELIAERLGWPTDRLRVSYQSKLGPAKWITPSTQDVLHDLAEILQNGISDLRAVDVVDLLEVSEIGDDQRQLGAVASASRQLVLETDLKEARHVQVRQAIEDRHVVQAGILDGDGGLVGHGGDDHLVVLGEPGAVEAVG